MKRTDLAILIVSCLAPFSAGAMRLAQGEYYAIESEADTAMLRNDAKQLAQTLDQAIACLQKDYSLMEAEQSVFRNAKITVVLHAAPNDRASAGSACVTTGWSEGRCTAAIDLLAPSAHPQPDAPGAGRALTGEPYDLDYCRRVLVHEFSTILLESITRAKPKGWSFQSAPSWFVQGCEEYLATTCSTERARTFTLPAYIRMTREQGLVSCDFGLDVQNPYVAGTALVAFVCDHYGRDRFLEILRSEEASFGKALRSTLSVTAEQFQAEFAKWLQQKAAAPTATGSN